MTQTSDLAELVAIQNAKPHKEDVLEAFGDQSYRETPDGKWTLDIKGKQLQEYREMTEVSRRLATRRGLTRAHRLEDSQRPGPRWGRATWRWVNGHWWRRAGARWVPD